MSCEKEPIQTIDEFSKANAELSEASKAPRTTTVSIDVRGKSNIPGTILTVDGTKNISMYDNYTRVNIGTQNQGITGIARIAFKTPNSIKLIGISGYGDDIVNITNVQIINNYIYADVEFTIPSIEINPKSITPWVQGEYTLTLEAYTPPVVKQVTINGFIGGGSGGYINIGNYSIPVFGSKTITVPESNKMSISFQSNSGSIRNVGGSADISIYGGSLGSRNYNGTIDLSRVSNGQSVEVGFEAN